MKKRDAAAFALYLKDRRRKIDATALGYPAARRRTPGLRREEVAQRANISPTWYICLEQGRGGAPSAEVLGRIANALQLSAPEREHLFTLGLGHSPHPETIADDTVPSNVQSVLNALDPCPAFVRTGIWNIVAWNKSAADMLRISPEQPSNRNLLRMAFTNSSFRETFGDWHEMAGPLVGVFRYEAVRAGLTSEANALASEIAKDSAEFAKYWHANDVYKHYAGVKDITQSGSTTVPYGYSVFGVEGRNDLNMVVFCRM
jgi:transcriptional regulator with XRE-family HTH domain